MRGRIQRLLTGVVVLLAVAALAGGLYQIHARRMRPRTYTADVWRHMRAILQWRAEGESNRIRADLQALACPAATLGLRSAYRSHPGNAEMR